MISAGMGKARTVCPGRELSRLRFGAPDGRVVLVRNVRGGVTAASWCGRVPGVTHGRPPAVCR